MPEVFNILDRVKRVADINEIDFAEILKNLTEFFIVICYKRIKTSDPNLLIPQYFSIWSQKSEFNSANFEFQNIVQKGPSRCAGDSSPLQVFSKYSF